MEPVIEIGDAIRQLLAIVERLRSAYRVQNKKFTLDGRLVGDIGEVLAEAHYDLKLFTNLQKHHDGQTSEGRNVQIKATMQSSLTFPVDHVPEYYLGLKIRSDGSFEEIFNGPGLIAWEAIRDRKATKTNLHSISISALAKLSASVQESDRIRRRPTEPTHLQVRAVGDGPIENASLPEVGILGHQDSQYQREETK